MTKYVLFLLTFFVTVSAQASDAWYWGNVTRIITNGSDGSFEILIDNPTIQSVCQNQIVFFKVNDMGLERTKNALSLALSAFMAGKEWGVVVDLPLTDGPCYASSTASQGAGIR